MCSLETPPDTMIGSKCLFPSYNASAISLTDSITE